MQQPTFLTEGHIPETLGEDSRGERRDNKQVQPRKGVGGEAVCCKLFVVSHNGLQLAATAYNSRLLIPS